MSAVPQVVLSPDPPMVSPAALISIIARAAENPAVDIDKMERLMQMHERLVEREAEVAFNNALATCQAEVRRVAADADNPQTKSKYATYAKLDKMLRPIYTAQGFAISYDTDPSPIADHIRILAIVSKGAHTRTYKVNMPADGKGAKGGDVMTKTHAVGAAMTYGMRYLLKGIFNVAIGEEDTDGNVDGMPTRERDEWAEKIEKETTKEAAKAVWREAVKACERYGDTGAAEHLKSVLLEHSKFIDQAGK